MANYYGQARSNYFAVKDSEAFLEEMKNYPVEIITSEKDGQTLYGFLDADDNGGGDIWSEVDYEAGETTSIYWQGVFKRHLSDGWVAIIMETGAEKYRYFIGHAVAYNNKGEEIAISLEDIYTLAGQLGNNITRAEY